MDNMVYIPVCRGWSINGAAQWDVVAVPANKAYRMGDAQWDNVQRAQPVQHQSRRVGMD